MTLFALSVPYVRALPAVMSVSLSFAALATACPSLGIVGPARWVLMCRGYGGAHSPHGLDPKTETSSESLPTPWMAA